MLKFPSNSLWKIWVLHWTVILLWMHMSPILLGHATLNCIVWHLFVDSWQVLQLPHLYLLLFCQELTTKYFLWKGYELSGEIALKNNHYYYYYYYCNSLLFGSTHDVTSHLQRIQNYAARVILCLPMSSSITIHLKSLHWLPVKVRSTYKIACLCYHCHSSTAPSYVTDMLHKKPLHTRNTRSSSYTMPLLNRPAHSKATLGDRSFSFASSSVWNSIPNDVRCAPSLSSFKSRLKTYLFCSVYKDWTVSLITVHMCMVWPCYSFVDGLS